MKKRINTSTSFKVVEKNNPLAVHALCDTRESAERWIKDVAQWFEGGRKPFDNKALTPHSFTIINPGE